MATSARGRDPAVEEEFLGALYKGGELLASGKVVEAREHLETANTLQPKNEKAQNLLGLTYFKLGLYEQAAAVYERLVNENPVDATLRVNLGLVFLKTNALERCVREFETATDLEPTHKKAHNYLGLALAQQGQYAKAKEHFTLAGSDQMAEKMGRALAAASQEAPPRTVVLSPPPSAPPAATPVEAPPPPPAAVRPPPLPSARAAAERQQAEEQEQPIEVMSDDELPADGEAAPEELSVGAPAQSVPRLESDWSAQLPAPPPETPTVVVAEEMMVIEATVEVLPNEPLQEAPPPSEAPAWLTQEAAQAPRSESQWVTESVADVPYAAPSPVPQPSPFGSGEVVQTWEHTVQGGGAQAGWAVQRADEQGWGASQQAPDEGEAIPTQPDNDAWATGGQAASEPPAEGAWAEAQAPASSAEAEGAATAQAPGADDESWATGAAAQASDAGAWSEGAASAQAPQADDESWATGAAQPASESGAWSEGAATAQAPQAADESWATGAAQQAADSSAQAPQADDESWAVGPPVAAVEPERIEALPMPAPSAPLTITVQEPVSASSLAPLGPAGYAPMSPQGLGDLGASGAWVREPGAGPFHLGPDGLAVTVSGEMLMRMEGLVAVVGSLEVKPEARRRRGRPIAEPFGQGPAQLQRVSGNGVVYLEPGRTRFHAVDLTDQAGVAVDDDGAYLREELVFAFEEPISFENGKVSGEGQSLELAHLKGTGRVLLQLDGSLRAMPIPVGAPLVVPLPRLVGWFGRVTPRLMGFGGRGAMELTGEGYALLGAPGERA